MVERERWWITKQRKEQLTYVCVLSSTRRDLVIYIFVVEKVEPPEGVKEEISKIFVHVGSQDPSVKAVDDSPSIHHLSNIIQRERTHSITK